MACARSARCAATLFAAVMLLAFVAAAPAQGSFPGRNGLLVFGIANFDYHEQETLTLDPGGVAGVNLDGSDRHTISRSLYPAFSPRGHLLALSRVTSSPGIYIHRPDGDRVARVTHGADVFATWAPSGRRLAFSRIVGYDPDGLGCEWTGYEEVEYDVYPYVPCPAQLYSVMRDGSDLRLIAERGWNPSWSSLGELAYVGADHGIWISDRDGGDARRLVPFGSDPDWSPDGHKLVFAGRRGLLVIRRDGAGRRRIVSGFGAQSPAWSPDGQQIAFIRSDVPREGVYRVTFAAPRKLPVRVTRSWCPNAPLFFCARDLPWTLYGLAWEPRAR